MVLITSYNELVTGANLNQQTKNLGGGPHCTKWDEPSQVAFPISMGSISVDQRPWSPWSRCLRGDLCYPSNSDPAPVQRPTEIYMEKTSQCSEETETQYRIYMDLHGFTWIYIPHLVNLGILLNMLEPQPLSDVTSCYLSPWQSSSHLSG